MASVVALWFRQMSVDTAGMQEELDLGLVGTRQVLPVQVVRIRLVLGLDRLAGILEQDLRADASSLADASRVC